MGRRKRVRKRKKKAVSVAKPGRAKKPKFHEQAVKQVNPNPVLVCGPPGYMAQKLMSFCLASKNPVGSGGDKRVLSRFEMKRYVSRTLKEGGYARDTASIAKLMPIYSESTRAKYERIWKMFFTYISENYGVSDARDVKHWHVSDFLSDVIDREVSGRTYKLYSSAISKLEFGLNKGRKYPIAYSKLVDRMNKTAGGQLRSDDVDKSRAYIDPEASINRIENRLYRLAARMQYEGGARISEISELTVKRNFLGIQGGYGRIRLTNTKGGRQRVMKLPIDTYQQALKIAAKEGVFEYQRFEYSQAVAAAFEEGGEEWNGTHGLRWNFAQRRFKELRSYEGFTYDEALQIVSNELGHSRPSITLWYLR